MKYEEYFFPLCTTLCVHKVCMHAGKETCGPRVYLSHTLSPFLFLIQGGGVQGLIGNKIRALNVINGFDFWNGS